MRLSRLTLVAVVAVAQFSQGEALTEDRRFLDSGLAFESTYPVYGPIVRYGPPAKFSRTPGRVAEPCLTGQHTAQLLAELGKTQREIVDLVARGVVFTPDETRVPAL